MRHIPHDSSILGPLGTVGLPSSQMKDLVEAHHEFKGIPWALSLEVVLDGIRMGL